MNDDFLAAFAELVKEHISNRNNIKLSGIGTFTYRHQKQYQQKYQDGRVVMMPPQDTINFIPDPNEPTNGY